MGGRNGGGIFMVRHRTFRFVFAHLCLTLYLYIYIYWKVAVDQNRFEIFLKHSNYENLVRYVIFKLSLLLRLLLNTVFYFNKLTDNIVTVKMYINALRNICGFLLTCIT